jgi:hypothetical protein
MAGNIVHLLQAVLKGNVMALSYEDLIEPAIVKQVSKTVAYCRCTRTKTPPFCDDHCHLPLLEVKGSPVLRRHTRPAGETQRTSTKESRLETLSYHLIKTFEIPGRGMIDEPRHTRRTLE